MAAWENNENSHHPGAPSPGPAPTNDDWAFLRAKPDLDTFELVDELDGDYAPPPVSSIALAAEDEGVPPGVASSGWAAEAEVTEDEPVRSGGFRLYPTELCDEDLQIRDLLLEAMGLEPDPVPLTPRPSKPEPEYVFVEPEPPAPEWNPEAQLAVEQAREMDLLEVALECADVAGLLPIRSAESANAASEARGGGDWSTGGPRRRSVFQLGVIGKRARS
jgi:hypothetical protein